MPKYSSVLNLLLSELSNSDGKEALYSIIPWTILGKGYFELDIVLRQMVHYDEILQCH